MVQYGRDADLVAFLEKLTLTEYLVQTPVVVPWRVSESPKRKHLTAASLQDCFPRDYTMEMVRQTRTNQLVDLGISRGSDPTPLHPLGQSCSLACCRCTV